MIFLLDNYDSFTYNLYQILVKNNLQVEVARNDKIDPSKVIEKNPSCIILSPGPGHPKDAGSMMELIEIAHEKNIALFGVCLGMQAIGEYFGAKVVKARELKHGKTCTITHDGKGLFKNLDNDLTVMRYHSLALDDIPEDVLEKSATSVDGELMAFRHINSPVEAVQFHPESFATMQGEQMLLNFINEYARN